ncbi:hypothetical protein [Umezakia ovalisporum]|uniref:hypothetical protein n=1 Tax=Umezakia ovalisporum TaxID=75695 RepID=UPI0039C71195
MDNLKLPPVTILVEGEINQKIYEAVIQKLYKDYTRICFGINQLPYDRSDENHWLRHYWFVSERETVCRFINVMDTFFLILLILISGLISTLILQIVGLDLLFDFFNPFLAGVLEFLYGAAFGVFAGIISSRISFVLNAHFKEQTRKLSQENGFDNV